MIKRGTLVYLLPGFEGILTFPEGVGFFSLHNVQPDFSNLSPGVELNFVLENCIGIKHGTPFYHLELLWTSDVCDVVRETRHEISTALKVFNIYTGDLSLAVSAILLQERSEISSIPIQKSGTVCFEISDREGMIRFSNMNYVWFYLVDISAVILKTLIGQKVLFESEVLWKSWTEKSSWSVATCLFTSEHERLSCGSLEDVPVLSTIGERLRSASMNACVRTRHKLFLDLIAEVQKSAKLAEPLANTTTAENLGTLPQNVAECSALQDSKNTINKNISKEIHPSHMNTCTTETLYFLNPCEAFFVIHKNRSIIWLHQDHIDEKGNLASLKPSASTTIHFSARRLWRPMNKEDFAVYEAMQVWRSGLKMPATPSETTINNCLNPSVVALAVKHALSQETEVKDKILEEALQVFMDNKVESIENLQRDNIQNNNMAMTVNDNGKIIVTGLGQPTNIILSSQEPALRINRSSMEVVRFLDNSEGYLVSENRKEIIIFHKNFTPNFNDFSGLNNVIYLRYHAKTLWRPPNSSDFSLHFAYIVWGTGLEKPVLTDSSPQDSILYSAVQLLLETEEKEKNRSMQYLTSYLVNGDILNDDHGTFLKNNKFLCLFVNLDPALKRPPAIPKALHSVLSSSVIGSLKQSESIESNSAADVVNTSIEAQLVPTGAVEQSKSTDNVATSTQAKMAPVSTVPDKHPAVVEQSTTVIVRFINEVEGYLVDYERKRIIWIDNKSASPFAKLTDINSVPNIHYCAYVKWAPPLSTTDSFALYRAFLIWGTGSKKPTVYSSSFSGKSLLDIIMEKTASEEGQEALNEKMVMITSFLSSGIIAKEHENYLKTIDIVGLYKPIDIQLKRPSMLPVPNSIYQKTLPATSIASANHLDSTPTESREVSTKHVAEVKPIEASVSGANFATSTQERLVSLPTTVAIHHPTEVDSRTTDIVRFINEVEGYLVDYERKRIIWFDNKAASRFSSLTNVNSVPLLFYIAKVKWIPPPTAIDSFALYRAYLIWGTDSKKPKVNSTCLSGKSLLDLIMEKTSKLEGPEVLKSRMAMVTTFLSNGEVIKEHENYLKTTNIFGLYTPIDSKLKRPSTLPMPNNIYLANITPSTKGQQASKASRQHPEDVQQCTTDIFRFINEVEGYLVDYERKRLIWIDNKAASPFAKFTDINRVPNIYYRAKVKWTPPPTTDSFALYRAYLIWGTGSNMPKESPACFTGRSLLDLIIEKTAKLEGPEVLKSRMAMITKFLSSGEVLKEHENYLRTTNIIGLYQPIDTKLRRPSMGHTPTNIYLTIPSPASITTSSQATLRSLPDYTPFKTAILSTEVKPTAVTLTSTNTETTTQLRSSSLPNCAPLKTVSILHPAEVENTTTDVVRFINKVEGYLVDHQRKRIIWIDDKSASPFARLTDVNNVPAFYYHAKLKWAPPPTAADNFALYRAYLIWGTASKKPTVNTTCFDGRSLLDISMEKTSSVEGPEILNKRMAMITTYLTNGRIINKHENYLRTSNIYDLYRPENPVLKRPKQLSAANKIRIYSNPPSVPPSVHPPNAAKVSSVVNTTTLKPTETVPSLNHYVTENSSSLASSSSSTSSRIPVPNTTESNMSSNQNDEKSSKSRVDSTEPVTASTEKKFQDVQCHSHQSEIQHLKSRIKMRFTDDSEAHWVDHNRKEIYWLHKVRVQNFSNFGDLGKQSIYNYTGKLLWDPCNSLLYALYEVQAIWSPSMKIPEIAAKVKYTQASCLITAVRNLEKKTEEERNEAMTCITNYLATGQILNDGHREILKTYGLRKYFIPDPTASTSNFDSPAIIQNAIQKAIENKPEILMSGLSSNNSHDNLSVKCEPYSEFVRLLNEKEGYFISSKKREIVWIHKNNTSNQFSFKKINNERVFKCNLSLIHRPTSCTDFVFYETTNVWISKKKPIFVSTNILNCENPSNLARAIMFANSKTSKEEKDVLFSYIGVWLSTGKTHGKLHEEFIKVFHLDMHASYVQVPVNAKRSTFHVIEVNSTPRFPQAGSSSQARIDDLASSPNILLELKSQVPKEVFLEGNCSNTQPTTYKQACEGNVPREEQSEDEEDVYYKQTRVFYDDDDDYECSDDDDEEEDEFYDLQELEDLSTGILMKLMLKKLNLEWKNKNVRTTYDEEMMTSESSHCLQTANKNSEANEEVEKSHPAVSLPSGSTALTHQQTDEKIDCLRIKCTTEGSIESAGCVPAIDSPGGVNIEEGISLQEDHFVENAKMDVVSNDPIDYSNDEKANSFRNGQVEWGASTVLPLLSTTSSRSQMIPDIEAAEEVEYTYSTRDETNGANFQRIVNGGGYVYGNQLGKKKSDANCVIS